MELYNFDNKAGMRDTLSATHLLKAIKAYPKTHKFRANGRSLDSIAYNLYGNIDYWEILAEYNNIVNPYEIPEYIYIIPLNELERIINA